MTTSSSWMPTDQLLLHSKKLHSSFFRVVGKWKSQVSFLFFHVCVSMVCKNETRRKRGLQNMFLDEIRGKSRRGWRNTHKKPPTSPKNRRCRPSIFPTMIINLLLFLTTTTTTFGFREKGNFLNFHFLLAHIFSSRLLLAALFLQSRLMIIKWNWGFWIRSRLNLELSCRRSG